MKITGILFICIALLAVSGAIIYGQEDAAGDARALFEGKCSACHSTDVPKAEKMSIKGWEETVEQMRRYGCRLSDSEAKVIIEFLAKNYGR
ncbi:MAG: hypothetical protein HZA17_03685 [Nitrospirae bacterium]|nr:hypothetical protein [Nitrospirota bacterium]